jgi:hypothetical protein
MPGRQDATIIDQDDMGRFVTCGFGFYRTSTMIATMFVALELKAQLQDEDSLGPSPYRLDLFSLLSDAKMRTWRMIECGETNVKGFLLASLVTAQIEALMQGMDQTKLPGHLVQAAEQAQERCLAFMEEKAGQGYSENIDEGNQMSINPSPFMGDWEFIVSGSLVSTVFMLTVLLDVRRFFQSGQRRANELGLGRREQTFFDVTCCRTNPVSDRITNPKSGSAPICSPQFVC